MYPGTDPARPSRVSYNMISRQANVANNHQYIRALKTLTIPATIEILSKADRINDYLLTSLRTDEGCNLSFLRDTLGYDLMNEHKVYLDDLEKHRLIALRDAWLKLTSTGKLVADRIASDLFYDHNP